MNNRNVIGWYDSFIEGDGSGSDIVVKEVYRDVGLEFICGWWIVGGYDDGVGSFFVECGGCCY